MALAPGDKFGRYSIVGTLGIGGMGQVLRAEDSVLERTVALKIIRADKADHGEVIARFFREAKLAAQLAHPNTVQIYDLGEVDGVPFIAMEYIDGKPLTRLCGDVSVDAPRKLRWMLSAARGLAAAHRRGMVHRDVKPANIMVIAAEDVVKVVDFGLAKRSETTEGQRRTFRTELGFIVGTPVYMAPEQLEGAAADARSDQFSWGLTAYALLVGENPRRIDPMLNDPIKPIGAVMRALQPDAAALIMKALELDPVRRHATMDQLVSELDALLNAPVGRVVVTTGAVPVRMSVAPVPIPTAAAPMRPSLAPVVDVPTTDKAESPLRLFKAVGHPLAPRPLDKVMGGYEVVLESLEERPPAAPIDADRQRWRFERRVERRVEGCSNLPLQLASFSPDGKRILAFAAGAIVQHLTSSWHPYPSSTWLSQQTVACVAFLADGSAVVGGTSGLAAHISPNGRAVPWPPMPLQRDVSLDVCFRGVEVTPEGWITFVGTKGDDRGVMGWVRGKELELATAPLPLTAVVTMRAQRRQLACGPNGALVAHAFGMMTGGTNTVADLLAIASSADGAHVVGAGGYALYVTEGLHTVVEAVETTSALVAVTRTPGGTVWAASSRGRILRRDAHGRWLRVSPDFEVEPNLIAIWASEDRVRAVAADGSLILGWRLRDDPAR